MKNILQKIFGYFLIVLLPTLFCSLMSSPLSYSLPLHCPPGSRVIGIECFNDAYENTTPWYRTDFGASELSFPFWLILFGSLAAWGYFSSSSAGAEKTEPPAAREPHRAKKPLQQPKNEMTDRSKLWLPTNCPHCGGSISTNSVQWPNPYEAQCPYCASVLKA
jgi:hypothetical protein